MHACPLKLVDWEAKSKLEQWLSDVVLRNPCLRKCVLDCGASQVRGVALSFGEQFLYVHIEDTICDRCGVRSGPCAVPDFGVGGDAYREFVGKQRRESCPSCGQELLRRHVIQRLA
jgi:hypothetical protein